MSVELHAPAAFSPERALNNHWIEGWLEMGRPSSFCFLCNLTVPQTLVLELGQVTFKRTERHQFYTSLNSVHLELKLPL